MSETPEPSSPSTVPSTIDIALRGLCPRCGAPVLFDGVATFAEKCRACGLDFAQFNVGDGPAAFLTLVLGAIITALAITLELTIHPPFWVHLILWIPLTAAAVVLALRASKAALLALEYRNKAGEVRNEDSR